MLMAEREVIVDRVVDELRLAPHRRLSLEEAAAMAGYSPFHFHRVFKERIGESYHTFSNRVRLTNAARQLRNGWHKNLLDLALENGFQSASDFSRVFRSHFEASPSEALKGRHVCLNESRLERKPQIQRLSKDTFDKKISLRTWGPIHVCYRRVINPMFTPDAVKNALTEMAAWAIEENILSFQDLQMVALTWDDFDLSPHHQFLFDAGVVVTQRPHRAFPGMSFITLPKCEYAVFELEGDLELELDALDFLSHQWCRRNGYLPAPLPHIEVFLNERSLYDWDRMKLLVAYPVRRSSRIN